MQVSRRSFNGWWTGRAPGVLVAVTVALGLIGVTAAHAAAAIPGGFAQLAGPAGCLSNAGADGCTAARSLGFSPDGALSPDGRNYYVTTYGILTGSIAVFDRDPATGRLAQKPGHAGCLHSEPTDADCVNVPVMSSVWGITVSPDGRHVYAASYGNDRVLAFSRAADGTLTLKAGGAGCVSNNGDAPCRDARALGGPVDVLVSPDGKHLYVNTFDGDSITAFTIGADGGLTQITDGPGGAGCIQNVPGPDGCADGRAMDEQYQLAFDPGGTTLYSGTRQQTISGHARDAATGRLAPLGGPQGCVTQTGAEGCAAVAELTGAVYGLASTAGVLYATAGSASHKVLTFDRQPSGGLVRRPGAAGCVSNADAANCTTGRGLNSPAGVAVTRDGADVYVTSEAGNGALVELDRSANGTLTPRAGTRGCAAVGAIAGCAATTGLLTGPYSIAISPDDRFIYTTNKGGRIGVFKRDSSGPVCTTSTVTVQAGSVGPLKIPCSDPDGDALTYSVVNPPTLGNLGAIDDAAGTIVYAAPQGQNGTTTITIRASYSGFTGQGSIKINVVGAPPPPPPAGGGGGGTVVLPAGIDADGDGFFAGQDCNDNNPAIRPGAVEVKGNRIDENCDGLADPFPTLTSGVVTKWGARGNALTLSVLQVTQQFPKGWKAEIRCSGKPKCPFKVNKLKAGKVRRGAANIITSLTKKQRRFRAGQTVEVWVSAPGFNTTVKRYVLKRNKIPTTQPFCVIPGQSRPQKSCS